MDEGPDLDTKTSALLLAFVLIFCGVWILQVWAFNWWGPLKCWLGFAPALAIAMIAEFAILAIFPRLRD